MDPISQGVLGAAAAALATRKDTLKPALIVGVLAGMAPDLDILIRSDSNPLLMMRWHRHFTHALPLAPLFGPLCAALLYPFARKWLSFKQLAVFATLGWGTHGLLDGCTTYGTWLWWPFSDARVNWDLHAIIDPLYTLPMLGLLLWAWHRNRPAFAVAALCWSLLFTGYTFFQHRRAETIQHQLADHRGHLAASMRRVMPTIGNSWLWRSVYLYGGEWHSDALYLPPWRGTEHARYIPGEHYPAFRPQDAEPFAASPLQADDLRFFRHFADDYLLALDPGDGGGPVIADARYGVPAPTMKPMWGIRARPDRPQEHVSMWRGARSRSLANIQLFRMLQGEDTLPLPYHPSETDSPDHD